MTNYNMLTDPFGFSRLTKDTIGFDDIFKRLASFSENLPKISTYPPYNIRKTGENTYVIEVAVAGFGKQDIELTLENGILTVKGQITGDDASNDYIFKGIANRAFTRAFTLADTVKVQNAELLNGMLKVWLERFISEDKKPQKIDIKT